MGNGSQDGGLIFCLSGRFYDERKDVLNHLILQFGRTQPFMVEAEVTSFLEKHPSGGYIHTTSVPLIAYLRLNGMTETAYPKGE